MVDQPDGTEDFGIDFDADDNALQDEVESIGIDLDDKEEVPGKLGLLETVGDVLTQAGRGFLKKFSYPLDILKMAMIGEGLEGIDEVEAAYLNAGKPFDRAEYLKNVFETAEFIPSQDLLEKGVENLTGISLEPKTELGRRTKQGVEIASFAKGGGLKKAFTGATAAVATAGLKAAGVPETPAELIGDIGSLAASSRKAIPLSSEAQKIEKTATKHALPFMEYMVREREPFLKGRLLEQTKKNLKKNFNVSTDQAFRKIVRDEIPIKNLQDRGVNLDALASHAYNETARLAKAHPNPINTSPIIKNIDAEISRIKARAPSPSDAQRSAIQLLERERDILKISKPNSEQLVNQHINYNADMKQLYRKPEFSGREEEVRKTYEFLKNEIVEAMNKQGSAPVANAFKAANKIYTQKSKLEKAEQILGKTFKDGDYNPKKLDKILNSRDRTFLERSIGKKGIKEIEEINEYGKKAQGKIKDFIEIDKPIISTEIKSWGYLAPLVFALSGWKSGILYGLKPLGHFVQGKLLTRPVTRSIYKNLLKNASEGSFELLKKDFDKLNEAIAEEYGSVDNFLDEGFSNLEIFSEEDEI